MGNFMFPDLCLWNFWQLMETLSQTVSTDTFDNWNLSLTSWGCPVTIILCFFDTTHTVSRIWPSTIINMYHPTHSSVPTNSSYFTSSHPQQSQPTSHQTSFLKKNVCSAKTGRSLMEKNRFLWWETATSRRLPNRVAKDVHQLKETEDIVWILTICFQLSPKPKTGPVFFWKNGFLFGYIHHVQPGKKPMAAEGQQWLASNWGGDHNTENQQFHGEEHHDQCEHLRIGELLAFGFSNGRTLLRLKEMVHHKIPWSRGNSMAVKILRP